MVVDRRRLTIALSAQGSQLGFVPGQHKSGTGDFVGKLAAHDRIAKFGYGSAAGADYQQIVRVACRIQAGRPCVDRIETVYQPLFDEELERPVYSGRDGTGLHAADFIQQLIGFQAAVLVQKDLEYLAAYRGQPLATLQAKGFCRTELCRNSDAL